MQQQHQQRRQQLLRLDCSCSVLAAGAASCVSLPTSSSGLAEVVVHTRVMLAPTRLLVECLCCMLY